MYGCESWTIKKAECQIIDAFELWCWRFLRVPWTARRSNQSILKQISPEYSLEGLMLRLKLQYVGHQVWRTECENFTFQWRSFHWKRPWCWERLKVGGERNDRGWDGWMASLTQWTWVWVNSGVVDGQGGLECCSPWGHKESDTTEWLNWTWYWKEILRENHKLNTLRCRPRPWPMCRAGIIVITTDAKQNSSSPSRKDPD